MSVVHCSSGSRGGAHPARTYDWLCLKHYIPLIYFFNFNQTLVEICPKHAKKAILIVNTFDDFFLPQPPHTTRWHNPHPPVRSNPGSPTGLYKDNIFTMSWCPPRGIPGVYSRQPGTNRGDSWKKSNAIIHSRQRYGSADQIWLGAKSNHGLYRLCYDLW